MAIPFWLMKACVRSGLARWVPGVRRRFGEGAAALRYLSDRALGTPVEDLDALARFWQADAPDAIDLASCTPKLDLAVPAPPRIVPGRGYPPPTGLLELRRALADHLAETRMTVNPADEIVVTHGASAAYFHVLDTFLNPGDRAVLFAPSSPLFPLGLKHRRARIRWVPTTVEHGRLRFAMEPFTRALPGAKILVLADPANPTGAILAPEDLEQIAWWADKYDVLIHADASFDRFRDDGASVSIASLGPARHRTLVAGSASKGGGLVGARVGWLAGPRALIRLVAAQTVLTAPFIAPACQQAAAALVRLDAAAFAPARATAAARRRYACDRLRGFGLDPVETHAGLAVWTSVASLGLSGDEFARQLDEARRVLVMPGSLFGPQCESFVRVSTALDDGRLREGLGRLGEFVASRKRGGASASAIEPPLDSTEDIAAQDAVCA